MDDKSLIDLSISIDVKGNLLTIKVANNSTIVSIENEGILCDIEISNSDLSEIIDFLNFVKHG